MTGLEVRLGALSALARVGAGAHLDQSVDLELAQRTELNKLDRSLLTALTYQTVRHRRRLDLTIERAARRKMGRIDAELRDLLRLGAVQLFCFDSVPDHAAVDTSVTIAGRGAKAKAKGFVNGVLREIARKGFAIPEGKDPIRRIADEHSFPEWLVRRWVKRFGEARAREFADRMNRPATLVLRPAPGEDVPRLIESLQAAGFDAAPSPWIPDAIRVKGGHPADLPGWSDARFQIQDEASQAVGHLFGSGAPGGNFLDACAGLGTKAIQMAERLGPGVPLIAHDPSLLRLRALARVPLAASVVRPRIVRGRANGELPFADGQFSRVLVDAPCTGFGSVRRHPELKWRRGPGQVAKHALLQRAILDDALRVLAPGGTLVYATCTVTDEENEDVVLGALEGRSDLSIVSCAEALPGALRPCVGKDGFFRSFPDFDGIDAFFAAVLRRETDVADRDFLIAPSILAADFAKLGEEIRAVEKAGADWIHVDVMDGHFVPNLTLGPPVVEGLAPIATCPLDVHLMIEEPDRYLEDFVKAGAKTLTVHVEAATHLHRTIAHIRELGAKPGVSLNPGTPVESLAAILPDVDLVLLMSVNPGFGGQKFIEGSIERARSLRRQLDAIGSKAVLEIDGGIGVGNIRRVAEAGVQAFVAGSAIFKSEDYGATIASMRAELAQVR